MLSLNFRAIFKKLLNILSKNGNICNKASSGFVCTKEAHFLDYKDLSFTFGMNFITKSIIDNIFIESESIHYKLEHSLVPDCLMKR